jgi:hypothetical protein
LLYECLFDLLQLLGMQGNWRSAVSRKSTLLRQDLKKCVEANVPQMRTVDDVLPAQDHFVDLEIPKVNQLLQN